MPGQSGPGSNGNEGVHCIPQGPIITGTSPSDLIRIISRTLIVGILPLCRGAVSVFYSPSQMGKKNMFCRQIISKDTWHLTVRNHLPWSQPTTSFNSSRSCCWFWILCILQILGFPHIYSISFYCAKRSLHIEFLYIKGIAFQLWMSAYKFQAFITIGMNLIRFPKVLHYKTEIKDVKINKGNYNFLLINFSSVNNVYLAS